MFGFLFGKKVEKINLSSVAYAMQNRFWDVKVEAERQQIVVRGKYRNHQKDFHELVIKFLGGNKIEFLDRRGYHVTHTPAVVDQAQMYTWMKSILNVH